MKEKVKKGLAYLLSSVLFVSTLVAMLPQMALTVNAEGNEKAIQLVLGGVANNIEGAQKSNVYFGTYPQSLKEGKENEFNIDPIKWRVLSNSDGKLFLLSDQNLDCKEYHTKRESVTWAGSTIRSWLNGYKGESIDENADFSSKNFLGTAFEPKEQEAIPTVKISNPNTVFSNRSTSGGADTEDKVFLLSIDESLMQDYGFSSSYNSVDKKSGRVSLNTVYAVKRGADTSDYNGAGIWRLRSPGEDDKNSALVGYFGYVESDGLFVDIGTFAVRPALNINLKSILFTSAAEGGKKSGTAGADALTAVADYSGNDWKLTIEDTNRTDNFKAERIDYNAVYAGNTVSIKYSGAVTGDNEFVSAILTDANDNILYYGNIAKCTDSSGEASINIKSGTPDGCKLYVFNEQCNGDKKTDYSSKLLDLTAPKSKPKNINLVTNGEADYIEGAQKSNVYFGTYLQSGDKTNGFNIDPIKWRVLSNSAGKLFLLSDKNLDVVQYHTEFEKVTWEESTIRSWLNGYGASANIQDADYGSDNFIGTAFENAEQLALLEVEVLNSKRVNGGNDTNDKVYLLSIDEVTNTTYGFTYDNTRQSANTAYVAARGENRKAEGQNDIWWLRSPGGSDYDAAEVLIYGGVHYDGYRIGYNDCVRPAINLNLKSILFTSAAEGGKISGAAGADALTAVADYSGHDWKLTLLDDGSTNSVGDGHKGFTATRINSGKTFVGDTISIDYKNAACGTGEYISVFIVDSSDNVLFYGNIADKSDNVKDGKVDFIVPEGLKSGNYTVKIFSEKCNGDKLTDYASAFSSFPIEVVDVTFTSDTINKDNSFPAGEYALKANTKYNGTDRKLTFHDESRDGLEVTRDGYGNVSAGSSITISYKNATIGTDEKITSGVEFLSAVLVKKDNPDDILYYGNIVDLTDVSSSSSGTAYVNIPSDLKEGDYILKFFSEQCNGDYRSDYASAFDDKRTVSITVGKDENEYINTGEAIQMNSDVLAIGMNTENAPIVYFDIYDNNGTKTSDAWYVIGYGPHGAASADGKITLLAKESLGKSVFDSGKNEYYNSSLYNFISGSNGLEGRLTKYEEKAVVPKMLTGGSGLLDNPEYNANNIRGNSVKALMWPLSVGEAELSNKDLRKINTRWWLRSPSYNDINAAEVYSSGRVDYDGLRVDDYGCVRPALNINLESIIFTSAAKDGKNSGKGAAALKPVEKYDNGKEWKITIRDYINNRENLKVELKDSNSNEFVLGSEIDFTYEEAITGENEYISAMLFEKDGSIPLYYGRIVDLSDSSASSSGEASFIIPEDLTPGNYELKFYSEQYNGDYKTDVASGFSELRTIDFSVKKGEPTSKDFKITLPDSELADITYNGDIKSVIVEPLVNGMGSATVVYIDENNRESETAPTDAGTYKFKIVTEDGNCYNRGTVEDESFKFTIEKRTPTVDDFDVNTPKESDYDGNEREATAALIQDLEGIGNISVVYYKDGVAIEGKPKDAGEYTFKLNVDDSGKNFNSAENLSKEEWKFTINKAIPSTTDFKVDIPSDTTYDGNEKEVTITGLPEGIGEYTVTYYGSDDKPLTGKPKDNGKYKVKISFSEGTNFYGKDDLESDSWNFSIGKATPKASDFDVTVPDQDCTYDGNVKEASVTSLLDGIGTFEVVYYDDKDNKLESAPKEPGTYKVKINVAGSTNYEPVVLDNNWTFTIKTTDYEVVLELDDGTVLNNDVKTYTYGEGAKLPTAEDLKKDGHTFDGWYETKDFSGEKITVISDKELGKKTYYAKWIINKYIVKFMNGDEVLESKEYEYGSMPSYDGTPSKDNVDNKTYYFTGWDPAIAKVTCDVTYTAQFGEDEIIYTITFEPNGGSYDMISAITNSQFKLDTIPEPTLEGYKFLGWFTAVENGTKITTDTVFTADTTVYALWEEVTEPEEEEEEEPKKIPNYLDELFLKLNIAAELGGKQTVYWNVEDSLPYDVLHFLELHEDITLIFDYTYEDVDYQVTLGGKGFEADPTVPWAGPLYLYSVYKGKIITKED